MLVYLAFACSGAAALIYEIVWTRLLTLSMGHTVAAASTVLAAFMGGLAIGAWIAGRIAPGLDRPAAARAYAKLEVLVALFAVACPLALAWCRPLLSRAYADGTGGIVFSAVRLCCAIVVVIVPAIAMGATLPLVARWRVHSVHAGRDTGLLYAANTIGAATSAMLAGFVLLPALGMRLTTWVGVGLNMASAALAWRLAATMSTSPAAARPVERARTPPRKVEVHVSGSRAIAALALGISGCASLILQVAWTRILAVTMGPTTYAFSTMVAVFIAGIAIGSFAGSWLTKRVSPAAWLAASLLFTALSATAAAAWAPQVPLIVADAVAAPGATFDTALRMQILVIAALMLPMTISLGVAFPVAVGLAVRDDQTLAGDVAVVYTANTVGAITGALAGGFVLVPAFGLEGTVRAAAVLAVGGFALVAATGVTTTLTRLATALAIAGVAIAGIWRLPAWDRELLSSGAYKYAPYFASSPYRSALLRAGELLFYREGAAATVSVRRVAGSMSLAIDGKVDASNGGDMLTQRLLAHLPLLLHPAPRQVGIIGLGSGVTLGSALRHPIERADVLEISPEVVSASSFFVAENHHALEDRRAHLIVGDGRSHLLLGRHNYDVLISEPSNPWMAGVAALFTQEFFTAARRRLAPGGVFCQWAHAYDISDTDFRSIVATFVSVFPESAMWLVGSDVLFVGSVDPLLPHLSAIGNGWSRPGVAEDLGEVGIGSPELLLSLFAAAAPALSIYSSGAVIQRDDRLALEFTAPQQIYGRSKGNQVAVLRRLFEAQGAPDIVTHALAAPRMSMARGVMLLRAESYAAAFEELLRAAEQDPRQADIDGLLRAATPANRMDDATRLVRRFNQQDPGNVQIAVALSRIVAATGNFVAAAEPLRPAFSTNPPDLRAMEQLASVFADAGDVARLTTIVGQLERTTPDADATLYYLATLQYMTGRLDDAIRTAGRLCDRNNKHARGLNLLGAAYGASGRRDEARQAFKASLAADPNDPGTYTNLGELELAAHNARAAARWFAEAVILDPAWPRALDGLGRAVAAMREY